MNKTLILSKIKKKKTKTKKKTRLCFAPPRKHNENNCSLKRNDWTKSGRTFLYRSQLRNDQRAYAVLA